MRRGRVAAPSRRSLVGMRRGRGGWGGGVRAAPLDEDDSDDNAELQAALRQSLAESEPQRARGESKRGKGRRGGEHVESEDDDSVICIEDQSGASAKRAKDGAKVAPHRASPSVHRTVLVVDSDGEVEPEGSSTPRDGSREGRAGRADGGKGVRSRVKAATHFRERLAGTEGDWDWLGFGGGGGGRSESRNWEGGMAQRDSAAEIDFGQWNDDAPLDKVAAKVIVRRASLQQPLASEPLRRTTLRSFLVVCTSLLPPLPTVFFQPAFIPA